eukprot:jgi/Botrbrau1/18236/Bobra.53_1s0090.1
MRKLPRDGTEEMSRGELLHRLRTNIGTLHDLLRERQQRVAEEGSSRPRGIWRWLRVVRRPQPVPPAPPSPKEQENLEWALSDVRYCLAMGMAGNAGSLGTDPLVFSAAFQESAPVPGESWLPPLPHTFFSEATSGHLELSIRQVLPGQNRCLVDAVVDGKIAFLESLKLLRLMGSCKELVPILLTTPIKEEANGMASGPEQGPKEEPLVSSGVPCQSLVETLEGCISAGCNI